MVHRDLKLENVLFLKSDIAPIDNIIKVVDFGIAGVCKDNQKDKVEAGSLAYMPPECLSSSKSETSTMIDVWAIGCMFYAMLFGYLPFWGNTEEEFVDNIINAPLKFP